MRTSESKELQQHIDSSAALNLKVLSPTCGDTDRTSNSPHWRIPLRIINVTGRKRLEARTRKARIHSGPVRGKQSGSGPVGNLAELAMLLRLLRLFEWGVTS